MDDTLAGHYDACWSDDELPWADEESRHGDGSDGDDDGDADDGHSGDDDSGHDDGDGDGVADDDAIYIDEDARAENNAVDHGSLGGGGPLLPFVADADEELAEAHHEKMEKFKSMRDQSLDLGDAGILVAYDRAMHTEEKKFRAVRQECPAVVTAMQRRQELERAALAKQRAEVAELNEGKRKLAAVEKERKESEQRVKDIKDEIKKARRDLDETIALKTFSVEDLGKGKTTKQALQKAKKARLTVLDRVSRLGAGLSPAQANDFQWFKENWDHVNETHLAAAWPEKFAELIQKVQDDITGGIADAFSKFIHAESARCLSDIPSLRL